MKGVARAVRSERWRWLQRALGLVVALGLIVTTAPATAAPKEPELEPVPARLWVVAPSPKGAWLLRIDNEGEEPIRIPADVRLLRFEVRALDSRGKWPRRAKVCDGPAAFGLRDKFPYQRELVLQPGESFVEQFDPRVICFGDDAKLLAGGTLVKPTYGWKPRPRWSRRPEKPPFAADAAKRPRRFAPRKQLEAPTMLLSYAEPALHERPDDGSSGDGHSTSEAADDAGDEAASGTSEPSGTSSSQGQGGSGRARPSGDESPSAAGADGSSRSAEGRPGGGHRGKGRRGKGRHGKGGSPADKLRVPDELAAQLALGTSRYADARHPRNIVVSLNTENVGERPRRVALRRRQLSFTITGPDGVKRCPRRSVQHVIPPDLFRQLSGGKHITMRVRLAEMCPWDTFRRPGVYVVTPTLHATEEDRDRTVGALTAVVSSKANRPAAPDKGKKKDDPRPPATLVRVRRGMEPYYQQPPVVVPSRFFKIGEEAYLQEQAAKADEAQKAEQGTPDDDPTEPAPE